MTDRVQTVAAVYDIHGHLPALEAVLEAIEARAVDRIVVGGDIASGPMPHDTLETLYALGEKVTFIRGNADVDLVVRFDGQDEDDDDVWARRARWCAGQITQDQRDRLASLPLLATLEVSGLGRICFCHASPRNESEIFTKDSPPERVATMVETAGAPLLVCGHTHVQFDRTVAGVRILNAGSVGMPYEDDAGAHWLLLGPEVEFIRTSYDLDGAAARIRGTGYPEAEELVEDIRNPPSAREATDHFEGLAARQPE